ncbi:hypothetical protein PIB30_094098 [Stylosanthes scabra]|uniref:Uncharacterized protein n=1 Tax=Stylosanthes scabra TaxID=79078 RepID=A0ABU6WYK0_9FABA|nr:hypothetical protein [Stylosanthes scabra]
MYALALKGKTSPDLLTAFSSSLTPQSGRARRVASPKSKQPQTAVQPKGNSSKRPTPKSSSQPNKKIAKPVEKPRSSQAISQRPLFCVRGLGAPHVSPQKLRLMAKLPPRAWGNV